MKKMSLACSLFALCLLAGLAATAQSDAPRGREATRWLKQGSWRHGLTMQTHPSLSAEEFAAQYRAHPERWDKAFAFMQRSDLGTLAPGKYPIDGDNVYATISEYVPKDKAQVGWESHRRYADIQCTISGEEEIGVGKVADATVIKPYDSAADVANYTVKGRFYRARPGTFFIFFPQETHRPGVNTGGSTATVRKLVVKVRVAD